MEGTSVVLPDEIEEIGYFIKESKTEVVTGRLVDTFSNMKILRGIKFAVFSIPTTVL